MFYFLMDERELYIVMSTQVRRWKRHEHLAWNKWLEILKLKEEGEFDNDILFHRLLEQEWREQEMIANQYKNKADDVLAEMCKREGRERALKMFYELQG